ncbi:hypothetical protein B9T19_02690 [Ignatzschineria sp. F8392]|uniref:glycosyltransferase family protein n=1 Tax=Ignatzschineria sp. F8392 TaxID=1980117 RepID=UPI000B97D1B9|nr:glycosyltransferase [Ignatzschineria sp. F8392]OYQ81595.1 hypothetical protein B9T19_02690 [Ignatzschineria sp. F8392]
MQNQNKNEKHQTPLQASGEERQVVIDMSAESSIDRDLQFLTLKKELLIKNEKIANYQADLAQQHILLKELEKRQSLLIQQDVEQKDKINQYQIDIDHIESQLKELEREQDALLAKEATYINEIAQLRRKIDQESEQYQEVTGSLQKLQVNYEGMLAREERYLREIRQLKDQVAQQKNALYRTYSYRLGYLLIHSTKSLRNFIRLPKDLFTLYLDNKQRKRKKKILKNSAKKSYSRSSVAPLFHKSLQPTIIESGRDQVRVATIMDEFTAFCFAPEAETLQLTPTHFKEELARFKPDFLFIESAWQGKDGLWKLKISQQGQELLDLIQYCRDNSIKTLFWNKEDPVHFGTFIETAKLVDVVFTTDIDCIQKYKEILQHDDVYLMPFAAQPKTHNPIELFERLDKFNFAGSYYLKYPVRQRDFATLSEVAIDSKGLDIYDRNFDNDHPHYQFPERYQSLILGSLPPEEIDKAYKGYEFGINMNTIKQSQTMFARRVFEMLASNTIVLSNYSRGVRLLFGDLVVCSDNAIELQRQLDQILENELARKKFKLQGLRSIFREHTYAQRLQYILQKLKIKREDAAVKDQIAVIAHCDSESEVDRVIAQFVAQTISNKTLFILTPVERENSENIQFFTNSEALHNALQMATETQFSHFAIFNSKDYYGPYYLEDLLHSYCYLQYHNNPVATKASYYCFNGQEIQAKEGGEYQFVSEAHTTRSLYPVSIFTTLLKDEPLEDLLAGKTIQQPAFSTDALSYLENGAQADAEFHEKVAENQVVDGGVSLINHLLPNAEAIRFKHYEAPVEREVEVDISSIKETLRKEIKLTHNRKKVTLRSSLPVSQHRLIRLSQLVRVEDWNRMKIECDIQSKGDVLFVIEFLDKHEKQLTHVTLAPHNQVTLEIPEKAIYSRFNIRIKGVATVEFEKNMTLQLQNIVGVLESQTYDSDDIVLFTPEEIDAQLVRPKSKQISIQKQKEGVLIRSTLAAEKHAYLYFKNTFTRAEANLISNSLFETEGLIEDVDFRTVFIFLDKDKEKLSHTILKVDNCSHAMAIPEECEFVRIGFKITGSGSALIYSLKIGELKERVNNLIGKSDTLVLAKQYPAYDDLYKYGFLHSRLRAYKKAGVIVDMYRFLNKDIGNFREFESIDLFEGGKRELEDALSSGQYKYLLIHLIDKNMWDIVKKYQDQIKIFIWIHGAEIQTWQRRAFEFDLMSSGQIDRQKKLSDARVKFWQNLLDHEAGKNVHFIFVSKYLREESEEGLERVFPDDQTSIIHNYIDEEIFPYEAKSIDQRYNLLTIRPFSGKKYGNDITVNAILELAKSPQFPKFNIEICGDGPLFDETVEPLKKFENVIINKGFLSHEEMAEKYKQYGVFMNPTRWDSQGVSRDEARIAGLVSISSNITAVPEFVSNEDGLLVEAEDYKALAEKVLLLDENPAQFLQLSIRGRERVLDQCSRKKTIGKELELIK